MSRGLAANASLPIAQIRNLAGAWALPSNASSPDCFSDVAFPSCVASAAWSSVALASSSEQIYSPCQGASSM